MMNCKQQGQVTVTRIELPTPLPVGPVNTYVLQAGDENILVDCGPNSAQAKQTLLDGLHNLGLVPEDLTGVVLTHGHVDHVGLSGFLQARGVPVYSHPEVSSWLDPGGAWDAYRKDFYLRYYAEMGMNEADIGQALHEFTLLSRLNDRSVVNVGLRHGDVFEHLPNFKVLEVPGHAQAAIALYDVESGELVVGDQLLPHISSNALVEPTLGAKRGRDAQYTHSLLDYRRNLKYLQSLPIKQVYPGHGAPFSDVSTLVARRLRKQEQRRQEILELVREMQPVSAYDVALRYFSKVRNQASLILSETLGYLDWLSMDKIISGKRELDGVVRWTIVSTS